ncbi:TetR/AcrR family transcriptional regulator C-terminal domain-containing protein [Kitasatospora sp. NBC_01266]|uniref:TetR/AcrR family transcriptional regulator C-terminal domain-containing protein n=1 Tax=Kitasatospora sp. NBC_01266 TaxID=2903572 RepID=UPI002E355162|nr:TetR/AcrR family transcriptional regulator C-terminal domain-containing protein [Kitasatospora sp. NBC_01266]
MNRRAAPRYRQIVAELRQRIETGELAPGDRIPSTREITRQWGVAMATATKVLTELRHASLVRPVPGVGTVVDTGSRSAGAAHSAATGLRRNASDRALTPERIVATAIAVADAQGLAAVSMRRVAAELGVATMSLYRHVTDKDDLLAQMMDRAFATASAAPFPADPPESWREGLELAARTLWAMFRRHPWLAPALSMTRPQPIASAVPFTEWILTALDGRGLDLPTMFTAHLTLLNYVRGTAVNGEPKAEADSGPAGEEWMGTQGPAFQAILTGGRFPALERLTAAGYDFDLDELFEFGLQRLLDGIAALIREAP